MKRFLILILFSLIFPIQNSSAVSPSLDETIEFLINGEVPSASRQKWSIDECVITLYDQDIGKYSFIDLNKVNLNSIEPNGESLVAKCKGNCVKFKNYFDEWKVRDYWMIMNRVKWQRNNKALSHLYSNFCTGFKPAF